MKVKLLDFWGCKEFVFTELFHIERCHFLIDHILDPFFVNKEYLTFITFQEKWVGNIPHRQGAICPDYHTFLLFNNFVNVRHVFEGFHNEIKKISKVNKYWWVFQCIHFRFAVLNILGKCEHESFLNGYSMALTQKCLFHQAFESVDKRHVLG